MFCLPLAPFALAIYLLQKIIGDYYVLTNRSVEIRRCLGRGLVERIPFASFDAVEVKVHGGQAFYRSGDVNLVNGRGDVVRSLAGVPWPERFQQVISEAREARRRSDESLARINARK